MGDLKTQVTLRPIRAEDEAFVSSVFAAVRRERFADAGIPEQQLTELLTMQFQAQQAQYRAMFPRADFDLVCVGDIPVGYLYVDRGPAAVTLIDIALLPGHRGKGIGGQLTRELIDEAAAAGRPVRAHVEKSNRAWHLWQRLGFRIVVDGGVYFEIERPPAG